MKNRRHSPAEAFPWLIREDSSEPETVMLEDRDLRILRGSIPAESLTPVSRFGDGRLVFRDRTDFYETLALFPLPDGFARVMFVSNKDIIIHENAGNVNGKLSLAHGRSQPKSGSRDF